MSMSAVTPGKSRLWTRLRELMEDCATASEVSPAEKLCAQVADLERRLSELEALVHAASTRERKPGQS